MKLTDLKMNLSKKAYKLITILTIMGLSGIYADFFLSLNAYAQDPIRFIKYEANREIVYFFEDGIFPIIFFISVIGVPIFIYWVVGNYDKTTFKYKKEFGIIIFLFVYNMLILRTCAGLTWYHPVFVEIVDILQITSFIFIGGIFFCLLTIIVEDEYETKNKNVCS